MGKAVVAARLGPTDAPQFPRMVRRAVAHIVEPDGVRELRQKQQHHVAPRTDIALHPIHPVRPLELRNKVRGNDFTNMPQYGKLSFGPLAMMRLLFG